MEQRHCPNCGAILLGTASWLIWAGLLLLSVLGTMVSAGWALLGWLLLNSGLSLEPAMGPSARAQLTVTWLEISLGGQVLFGVLAIFAIFALVRTERVGPDGCVACGWGSQDPKQASRLRQWLSRRHSSRPY
jgi:hypothetical protein